MGLFRGVRVKVLSGGPWGGPVYIEVVATGTRCSVGYGAASRIMVETGESIPEKGPEPEDSVEDRGEGHERRICRGRRARGHGWCFWRRNH